jgi:hypothetical protein
MNITIIIYTFNTRKVIVKVPFEIVRETEKCFFTEHGRYLKSEIGEPVLRSVTNYPYIELVMVDADEKTLREELSKWFTNEVHRIKEVV